MAVDKQLSVHMADTAGSVDSTGAVVEAVVVAVDGGIPATLPGIAGIAGTVACIAGLLQMQQCMLRVCLLW